MAPTYFRREPGIERSNGRRGSALDHFHCASGVAPHETRRTIRIVRIDDDPGSAVYRLMRNGTRDTMVSTRSPRAIALVKAQMRRAMIAHRDALAPELRSAAAGAVAARPFPVPLAPGAIVSGFMPMKSEIDPLPLMKELAAAGGRLALPVVAGRGNPLVMRAWTIGEPLAAGVWGIREPTPQAAEVAPDILLVPLLAFDRTGHRLGYGGGYYDLSIAHLRARKTVVAIGLAYAAQEVAEVPATARDAALDLVLTEREVIDLRGV
jgi:5-formyltetrahydrofolate cyclo-ligase